jgi:hypothetical protein
MSSPHPQFPIQCRCRTVAGWYSSLACEHEGGWLLTAYVCRWCGRWQVWKWRGEEGSNDFMCGVVEVGDGAHFRPSKEYIFDEKIPWQRLIARGGQRFQAL